MLVCTSGGQSSSDGRNNSGAQTPAGGFFGDLVDVEKVNPHAQPVLFHMTTGLCAPETLGIPAQCSKNKNFEGK